MAYTQDQMHEETNLPGREAMNHQNPTVRMRSRPTRILLILCGSLCVALGTIGIFVPVLPTTPFLLLAAFCYARSSERFLNWLLTNRWFGTYIRNYREGQGLPVREKVLTIALLWLTILVSSLYFVSALWLRLLLLGIAVAVTVHLARLQNCKPDPHPESTTRVREF